ncbi:cilia- and flagella-associated protein 157-like [Anabas testudineus]|uniref:Cilia- and flagella-associated protein 157 n=1 Tax=Anabas testudineus TaxID=64144 RepID=A0A7N6AS24_ANATE|nr:cilia- and flagella-associated protein 157-like [Anabas testudineus]
MEDIQGSEDREKSLYLTQIRYLDEQLERCQLKCDKLQKQNKDLVSLYRALEQEKNDITEYLKYSEAAKEKEGDELVVKLEKLQQAAERDREALELQHSQEQQELQEQRDKLDSVVTGQGEVLKEQEEQTQQLTELLQQWPAVELLEKQLVCLHDQHEAAFQSLKMEALLERTKLMEERRSTVDASIKKKIWKIVQEERAQHSEQLKKLQTLLKKNMKLWEQKKEMLDTKWSLCHMMDQMRDSIHRFNQEASNCKEEMEQLRMKLDQMKEELEDCSFTDKCLQQEEQTQRLLLTSASDESNQKTAEVAQFRAELQMETGRRKKLEDDVQKAVRILRHILKDSENLSEKEMLNLLEILESTVPQGIDSAPQGSLEKSSEGQKPGTTVLKPDRAETHNLATDPMFLMARYRPGDLGLVPRPAWKQKPALSSSQQESLQLKVCSSSSDA